MKIIILSLVLIVQSAMYSEESASTVCQNWLDMMHSYDFSSSDQIVDKKWISMARKLLPRLQKLVNDDKEALGKALVACPDLINEIDFSTLSGSSVIKIICDFSLIARPTLKDEVKKSKLSVLGEVRVDDSKAIVVYQNVINENGVGYADYGHLVMIKIDKNWVYAGDYAILERLNTAMNNAGY